MYILHSYKQVQSYLLYTQKYQSHLHLQMWFFKTPSPSAMAVRDKVFNADSEFHFLPAIATTLGQLLFHVV